MTMIDAPSDRDYQEFLNPTDPDLAPAESEEDDYQPAGEPKKYASWIDQPCYSIAYLKLPKVDYANPKDEECPF